MREFEANCSMMWAVQPVIRLATNNGVNVWVVQALGIGSGGQNECGCAVRQR